MYGQTSYVAFRTFVGIDPKLLCKPSDQVGWRHGVFTPPQSGVAEQKNTVGSTGTLPHEIPCVTILPSPVIHPSLLKNQRRGFRLAADRANL